MYPALAVLQELTGEQDLEVLWVGGEGGMEADLVSRAGFEMVSIPAAGLHGVGIRALPGNLWKIMQGTRAARKLLAQFQPDALFFTGGFVAAPIAFASGSIPTVAFVPDIKPGFTLRFISRFADSIAIVAKAAKQYFRPSDELLVSGYPVRQDISSWSKRSSISHLKLDKKRKTLLVFGGSKGARSINTAVIQALPRLLETIQIVHISGENNWDQVQKENTALNSNLKKHYHPFPYLYDDMGAALAAADIVLSRAGASVMGEYPQFKLPSILVPIPFSGHIQHLNAAFMQKSGAALLLPDGQMSEKLSQLILDTIQDERRLAAMREAVGNLHLGKAAKTIANQIIRLGSGNRKGHSK